MMTKKTKSELKKLFEALNDQRIPKDTRLDWVLSLSDSEYEGYRVYCLLLTQATQKTWFQVYSARFAKIIKDFKKKG